MTELVVPAVRGLADVPVLVVVTTGAADPADLERAYGDALPANVRCTTFVPYDLLLPHVSCFVTNGGYTVVTLALAHGVPLVQAGTTEEKAEIGARIAWTGVGVRIGTTRPDPGAVRRGVDRVLHRPSSPTRRRVQADMARHDAGTEGADLLEQLARTRRPVLRTSTPTG
jgi:UDP:flavonoid glycosyltransferase YjiC (YdhE family)